MTKIDLSVIISRIEKIRIAAKKLARFVGLSVNDFKSNSDNIDIAERNLEVAIEAMLDIGNHIITISGFKKPDDYYDIFIILGKNHVLNMEFAESIAPLAGLRNAIVHDYMDIDHEQLLENIKNRLSDFEEFTKQIMLFV